MNYLQILLYVNIFFIGVIAVFAVQHAIAHFRHHSEEPKAHEPQPPKLNLPQDVKEHLLEASKEHFEKILNKSADELEKDLKQTVAVLNERLTKMGTEIVNDEMRRYRMDLDSLRKQTEANISNAQTEINQHQTDLKSKIDAKRTELEANLEKEIAAEKQSLIAQIDTKVSDAVTSFLLETLGHNVDLGAQSEYLLSVLEEHKAELIKGLDDETETS